MCVCVCVSVCVSECVCECVCVHMNVQSLQRTTSLSFPSISSEVNFLLSGVLRSNMSQ